MNVKVEELLVMILQRRSELTEKQIDILVNGLQVEKGMRKIFTDYIGKIKPDNSQSSK